MSLSSLPGQLLLTAQQGAQICLKWLTVSDRGCQLWLAVVICGQLGVWIFVSETQGGPQVDESEAEKSARV